MVRTLWAGVLMSNGRPVFTTIDILRHTPGVASMMGMHQLPSSNAVGDWLRRLGNVELRHRRGTRRRAGSADGMRCVQNFLYEVAGICLRRMYQKLDRILDFDASVIPEDKRYAQRTYDKQRGTMGYFAFMGPICVMAELEPGNHSPSDHIAARVKSCLDVCAKAGAPARALRSDAAGYVSELFEVCAQHKKPVRFYVRARNDAAVVASTRALPAQAWNNRSVRTAHDGTRTAELTETAHAMNKGPRGFRLVVERRTEVEAMTG